MPPRPVTRDQAFRLPPSSEGLISDRHLVRFVAASVDALRPANWQELGIDPHGNPWGTLATAFNLRTLGHLWARSVPGS